MADGLIALSRADIEALSDLELDELVARQLWACKVERRPHGRKPLTVSWTLACLCGAKAAHAYEDAQESTRDLCLAASDIRVAFEVFIGFRERGHAVSITSAPRTGDDRIWCVTIGETTVDAATPSRGIALAAVLEWRRQHEGRTP